MIVNSQGKRVCDEVLFITEAIPTLTGNQNIWIMDPHRGPSGRGHCNQPATQSWHGRDICDECVREKATKRLGV